MGVEVTVFLVIFSVTSLCLISFIRLFSMSFISFEMDFFVGGVTTALSLPLVGDAAAEPVDLRVLTEVVVVDDWEDWKTVVELDDCDAD